MSELNYFKSIFLLLGIRIKYDVFIDISDCHIYAIHIT